MIIDIVSILDNKHLNKQIAASNLAWEKNRVSETKKNYGSYKVWETRFLSWPTL